MRIITSNNSRARTSADNSPRSSEAGFTLVEMVVAMVILMVGLLGVASAIGYSLMVSNRGRNVTNNKLLLVSILEQMETLRDTGQLTFGQIANTGSVDNTGALQSFAGFPVGPQPVSTNPGPDGIFGTADDLIGPGPDGVYGTADDVTMPGWAIPGYQRQIDIATYPSNPNLKKITVTLWYPDAGGRTQTMVFIGYLNNDARSNYLR